MKYAIVKAGSNQLKVFEGDKIKLLGSMTKPDLEVLFFSDGNKAIMDKAKLGDVKITTELIKEGKTRKIVVGRYKSKSRYDKNRGFRAQYTEFKVSKIDFGKTNKSESASEEDAKPVKKISKSTTTKKLSKKEDISE